MARGFSNSWPGGYVDDSRLRKAANVPALLRALARIRTEAVALSDRAYEAIQHHSFDPYREFCDKRAEHAALVSVLRGQIGPKPKETGWVNAVTTESHALVTLSIQACLKFAFALSANALMPLGARETFLHELTMLRGARDQLAARTAEDGVAGLLDELETALMILEEIVDRSPALQEL
jgi:hypothetical protein